MNSISGEFAFADMFAGIGGFHAALSALGGHLVIAAEKDPFARETYKRNWGVLPELDVVRLANEDLRQVPAHTVMAGGFPCQPFSKSGRQRGMEEERGQVFHELLKIVRRRRPAVVVLENVRNIAGPRQLGTWRRVIDGLREAGYSVAEEPLIVSPHRLPPELGGAPQSRERVFILGVFVGRRSKRNMPDTVSVDPVPDPKWNPQDWSLVDGYIDLEEAGGTYGWTPLEHSWLEAWDDFLARTSKIPLPSFPLWSDYWTASASVDPSAPPWKQRMERQNIEFFQSNRSILRAWQRSNPQLRSFPLSRRKFEWQAQDEERSIWNLQIQLRPSGIRVKTLNYAPTLVAMTQTPLIGPLGRKFTPRESARLQGFPDWVEFDHQPDKQTYKQLGNAVNVGVAYYVVRSFVLNNRDLIRLARGGEQLVQAVEASSTDPRRALADLYAESATIRRKGGA